MRHKLLYAVAYCAIMNAFVTTPAFAQNDFWGKELIVNGGAEENDEANFPKGWTPSEGYELHALTRTYEDLKLENIPENGGLNFFDSQEGTLLGVSTASTYQTVDIPETVWETIDANKATAHISALLGGYLAKDGNASVIYHFLDANSQEIKTAKLGPVTVEEREKQTCLILKESTTGIPAQTRHIRVELLAQKSSIGIDLNGFADNISLIISEKTAMEEMSLGKTSFVTGEGVDITYKNLPEEATIRLYKNKSMLPLKSQLTVGETVTGSGTFHVGNDLEEGDYTVKCTDASGDSIVPNLFFSVSAIPFADSEKDILVMSDIHVMSPELLVKEGSAFDSYLASDRKLLIESEDILNSMADTILARQPELVLIPGDLTKDGEKLSHQIVASKLHQLKDAGIQILVIPGNHDVNNPHAYVFNGDQTEYAETVSREEFAELYKDFGYGGTAVLDPNSLSYAIEPLKDLVVIGIDACKYEENTFISEGAEADVCVTSGRIKPETMEWIKVQADKAHKEGKQVIAMMHHNLVEHFNMQATIASPYVVDNAAEVRQSLMDAGIHTVFTGHFHIQDIAMDYNQEKTDSIYDISTGSTVTYPCPFRLVRLNEDNTAMDITSKILKSADIKGEQMKDFGMYAQKKLADGIAPMVSSLVTDYWDFIKQVVDENLGSFSSLINFPETPAELSQMLIDCLGQQAIEAYLTFSESNENKKDTEDLINRIITDGLDGLVDKLVSPTISGIAKPLIHQKVDPLLNTVLGSLLCDISNNDSINANVTDDLNLSIRLPKQDATSISDTQTGNDLKIYPLITDGDITISVPAQPGANSICIYNLNGKIIYSTDLQTQKATNLHYRFRQKGMYLVKLIGKGKATKVIVK